MDCLDLDQGSPSRGDADLRCGGVGCNPRARDDEGCGTSRRSRNAVSAHRRRRRQIRGNVSGETQFVAGALAGAANIRRASAMAGTI